ncbi:MAG: type II secretion system protein [Clostridiales bacterium]|nr:type II secretion system protein [Candidatus Scatonaster coprocaballi]
MRILNKNSKISRKGFTLLEMVLVLAIMLIMSVYLLSTFKIVNYSHLKVSKVNDMHDYASLNLNAISNKLCNATSISTGSDITCDGQLIILKGSPILPSWKMLFSWQTSLKFTTYPDSRTVKVEINLVDPSSGTSYHDETIVYCPGCTDMASVSGAGSVNFSYEVKDS